MQQPKCISPPYGIARLDLKSSELERGERLDFVDDDVRSLARLAAITRRAAAQVVYDNGSAALGKEKSIDTAETASSASHDDDATVEAVNAGQGVGEGGGGWGGGLATKRARIHQARHMFHTRRDYTSQYA